MTPEEEHIILCFQCGKRMTYDEHDPGFLFHEHNGAHSCVFGIDLLDDTTNYLENFFKTLKDLKSDD